MTALEFADALIRYCVALDAEVAWWGPSLKRGPVPYIGHVGALAEWTTAEVSYTLRPSLAHREVLAELLGLALEEHGNRDRLTVAPAPTA